MKSFVGTKRCFALVLVLLHCSFASAIGSHFYRATPHWHEPRETTSWLTSFDITVSGGSTEEGRVSDPAECNKNKIVNLLEIWGNTDLRTICNNVPSDPSTLAGGLLALLKAVPPPAAGSTFGQLQWNAGKFKTVELNLDFIQNIGKKGFFAQFHIPVKKLEIKDIGFKNLTSSTDPNAHTVEGVVDNLTAILTEFNLNIDDFKETTIGDIYVLLGWAYNSCHFDTTIRTGLSVPTGRLKDQDAVFSLPFGYDGHFGGIVSHESTLKFADWFHIGGNLNVLFFNTEHRDIRMKSAAGQIGPIKFGKGRAQIEQGPVWNAGTYLRFNEIWGGLSFLVGYSYAKQSKTKLTPENLVLFPPDIVNDDEQLFGWNMHTVNFMASYQFGDECSYFRPRLSAFYNLQAGGIRTFNTDIGGGSLGFDIAWDL